MLFTLKRKFIFLFSLAAITAQAQTVINGKVVDRNNEPLVGVNVSVKGSATATMTDADGTFTLSSKIGLGTADKVVFSLLGYDPDTVSYSPRKTNWVVVLSEKNVVLDDVVVTALGIKRNEVGLGYSTTKLEAGEITRSISANWSQALVGKVAGLNVNTSAGPLGSTRISLRGDVSLNQGGNNALIVVDGVPMSAPMVNTGNAQAASGEGSIDFGNGFSDLNPEDIESVQVLKGASATALYGSRAANGVIMVTTKNGSEQDDRLGGPIISMNSGRGSRRTSASKVRFMKASITILMAIFPTER